MTATRFPMRFSGAGWVLLVLGLRPAASAVVVDDEVVRARLGWMVDITIPRASVRRVAETSGGAWRWGWGMHRWRGEWQLNASTSGLVRMELDPPVRTRLLLVPIKIRVLRVAVEDPAGLVAALRPEP